jgi:3-oxoacyl-[acyl-carrier protein] reductase
MSSLSGMNVLVTGASGEIGAAIVESIAREGARPIVHYGRNEQQARDLLTRISGEGWIAQADLSDPLGPTALWEKAVEAAGRVHALVGNAGIRTEIAIDAELNAWQGAWLKEFQVNLFAAADLCRMAIKHFRSNGGGKIVSIASRAAQRGYVADAMPYGASKAALVNLTKSIARSFGKDGVVAVAIAPGWVHTEMADEFVRRFGSAAVIGDIPIAAMAECAEIAELVTFVLRSSQRSINGATLDVNGGSYLR